MTIRDFWERIGTAMRLVGSSRLGGWPGASYPKRWWPMLAGSAAVLIAATLALNVGMFLVWSRAIGAASGFGFDIAQVAVNRSELDETIGVMNRREAEFTRVLSASVPRDPAR